MEAAAVSHGLAVPALLLLAWAARRQAIPGLALPAAITALWNLLQALEAYLGWGREITAVVGFARDVAWMSYLAVRFPAVRLPPQGRNILILLAGIGAVGQFLALAHPERLLQIWAAGLLPALFAVTILVLLEQLWRNTPPQQRWAVKFICLGLGLLYAFEFYLRSESLLFTRPDMGHWAALGVLHLLLAPLLWIAHRRLEGYDRGLTLSHAMAFHTTTLLAAGAYLLIMALVGHWLRDMGGVWGGLLQGALLASAVLLLLIAVFSGAVQARLKSFLGRHFFRYRYDYREQWLRFTALLDSGHDDTPLQERAVQAMARLVDSPGAALWLRTEAGAFQRATQWNLGRPQGEVLADHPFIRRMERNPAPLDLPGLRLQGAAPDAPPDWLLDSPRAGIVVPLSWNQRLIGFILLAPTLAPTAFDWEINELLRTAARQTAAYLAQAEAAEALSLARQFESFHRTSAFVVHDIKNLVAQLSLLLSNADKHRHNPEFQADMLATIESAVARMNRMLVKLAAPEQAGVLEWIELDGFLRDLIGSFRDPRLQYRGEAASARIQAHPERLARAVRNMVRNGLEALTGEGKVSVTLKSENARAGIVIADTGRGMDETFIRNDLFRPFYSTKGAGMGIGAYECKSYVAELGGMTEVESQPGQGAVITLWLPLSPEAAS